MPRLPLGSPILDLIRRRAEAAPGAPALLAPGRAPLTYRRLADHLDEAAGALRAFGLGNGDRAAIVTQNGPEAATAFLAVAAVCAAAPLNPDYGVAEFEFYLSDLEAKVLIASAGGGQAARQAAAKLGLPVIDLEPAPTTQEAGLPPEAGLFRLSGPREGLSLQGGEPGPSAWPGSSASPGPQDVALVLHTSGTTSRPKLVPLTQANLAASAGNIRRSLELGPGDRCLNVMPLFHVHGLVGALLSSLSAGASVVSAPGFWAPSFFEWLDAFRPTWYTAVPTMHQAILARAEANADVIGRCPLRFIRSCSSALPPTVAAGLEAAFGAPVIEAYGMTEAAHQMASNPLPPGARKPGSVGLPTGPEVAILDDAGQVLKAGQPGEVAIKGENVMRGYERNPEANARAFTGGWFRTGDQGYLDPGGYLHLTGRLKEIINRGGEKISPREIDEVLLEHRAVAQAVAFAIPDARLGEDVAAVVVLKSPGLADAAGIRAYAATRLAHFKVPRLVLVADEIPKGPTGKVQRIGLAERLGLTGAAASAVAAGTRVAPGSAPDEAVPAPYVAPRTPTEATLAAIWQELLEVERVGVDDDFLGLGGDSVLAARIVARVNDAFGVELGLVAFFEAATVAGLAEVLERARGVEPARGVDPGDPTGEVPPR